MGAVLEEVSLALVLPKNKDQKQRKHMATWLSSFLSSFFFFLSPPPQVKDLQCL